MTVEEQSTGEFSVGVGYSSLDQTSFSIGLDERNFLGTGRGLSFAIDVSKSRSNLRLGLSEPYLFGRNLTGRAAVFNEKIKKTRSRLIAAVSTSVSVSRRQTTITTVSDTSCRSPRRRRNPRKPSPSPVKTARRS